MEMPIIDILCKYDVRFVMIGGQAMRFHGMPRFTMDWDICIPYKDVANFERLNQALEEIDEIPVVPLGPKGENFVQTYQTLWGVVQFHLRPPGLPEFDELERKAAVSERGIPYASASDLLKAKEAANRSCDQLDIDFLRRKINKG